MTLALIRLWLVCLADAVSTYIALRHPGLREKTPIVAWFIDRLGLITGLAVITTGVAIPVTLIGLASSPEEFAFLGPEMAEVAHLIVLGLVLAATAWRGRIVLNNIRLIREARR